MNLLGQCYAHVAVIGNTPLRPDIHHGLLHVSLNKGALATTAIEGNTLSAEDLAHIQRGNNLEPSRMYQQKEVENILHAFNTILNDLVHRKHFEVISPDLICRFNEMVGRNIGEAFNGNPGKLRRANVIVGAVYRPPSCELVENYLRQLCDWLYKEFHYGKGQNFDDAVIEAIVTHVYIAWIHPFMDGNGRTARLLEFFILLRAGVPSIASHILSNYYNDTRTLYYKQLEHTSETGDLSRFIEYALEGFRDGLEQCIKEIHQQQIGLTWNNYVHDKIDEIPGKNPKNRRRLQQLAYTIPADKLCTPEEIRILSVRIAEDYRKLGPTTLRRDLDLLVALELLLTERGSYRSNHELLRKLIPDRSTSLVRHY